MRVWYKEELEEEDKNWRTKKIVVSSKENTEENGWNLICYWAIFEMKNAKGILEKNLKVSIRLK